jgi:hypothetical protein
MKRFSRSSILVCAALLAPTIGWARDPVDVNLNKAAREYCHVLRFPLGWKMPQWVVDKDGKGHSVPNFGLAYDYEFRVPGLLGTRFLVRGFEKGWKDYTSNLYEADLSDQKGVAQAAGEQAWDAGAVIRLAGDEFSSAHDSGVRTPESKYVEYKGLQFLKSGSGWDGHEARLSPDLSLMIVQSWSGRLAADGGSDVPGGFIPSFKFPLTSHGKLFFDVYDADSAKKMITMIANFHGILPQEVLGKTGWVTERYFIVPLDQQRNRCLVCEFRQGRK